VSSRIRTGNLVSYAGSPSQVLRVLGAEAVLLRSDTGAEVSVDPLAIRFPDACPAALPSLLVTDELTYNEGDWAEATRRHDLVTALAGKPSRTTADVVTAAMSLGVTPRHVWGLPRRSRAVGLDIAGFPPSRRGPRVMRLSAGIEAIIQQAIDQHYAKPSRPGLQSLVREVAGRCKAADLPSPSTKAVKARVRARDQVWLARRREGPRKARSLALLTGAHPGAAAPWERVQIDSTPCDIRLVAETQRTVIGRPTITFAIDIYSRTVLGFSVSLQSASTITVATCLAHACLPKQDWLAPRDLTSVHWPVWGKPLVLEYDQGPENEAKGIQRGLRLHGIRSKVRQKGHPEHHGTIERLIGTMMRRIHERRGATFSSINERGDAEPDRLACLSLPELEQVVVLEIDHYNHSTHDGIGDRPIDRYLDWYKRPDLPGDQRIPPLPSRGPSFARLLAVRAPPSGSNRIPIVPRRLQRARPAGDVEAAKPGEDRARRGLRPAQPGNGLGRRRRGWRVRLGALPCTARRHDAGGERGRATETTGAQGRGPDQNALVRSRFTGPRGRGAGPNRDLSYEGRTITAGKACRGGASLR
jgi:putative transposase